MTNEGGKDNQIIRRISRAPRNPNLALDSGIVGILTDPNTSCIVIEPRLGDPDIEVRTGGKIILFVLDSSSSMTKHRDAVMRGYNGFLGRMKDSSGARNTMVHTVDIYGNIISPLGLLDQAKRIDSKNYDPASGGSTPLRDALVNASVQLVHEIQRQFERYKIVNGIVMALTDGEENTSSHKVDETKLVIEAVRKNNNAIYVGAGVGDRAKYLKEFGAIGIPEQFVISGTDIEAMFRLVGDATIAISDSNSFRALAVRGLPVKRFS